MRIIKTLRPLLGAAAFDAKPIDKAKRCSRTRRPCDGLFSFSHDATTHHFHLLKDGGEIVVTANDPMDKTSIKEILDTP